MTCNSGKWVTPKLSMMEEIWRLRTKSKSLYACTPTLMEKADASFLQEVLHARSSTLETNVLPFPHSERSNRNDPDLNPGRFLSDILLGLEISLSVPGFERQRMMPMFEDLARLYGSPQARLSLNGTSGSLLATFLGVLPRLQPNRSTILLDEKAHISALGGLTWGQWSYRTFERDFDRQSGTVRPACANRIISVAREMGPESIAAICLVSPDYNGFENPADVETVVAFARHHSITVIQDAAWGAMRSVGRGMADIVLISPHKRGLTPSPIAAILIQDETVASIYDEVMEMGFATTSPSFLQLALTEEQLRHLSRKGLDQINQTV